MAANEETSGITREAVSGTPVYRVSPGDIHLTNGAVVGRLGKYEVEVVAGHLVEFFQMKGRWSEFTLEELRNFYILKGWDPNIMLFGLAGRWLNDSGWGGGWIESVPNLAFGPDGSCFVTDVFVERCAGTYRKPAS